MQHPRPDIGAPPSEARPSLVTRLRCDQRDRADGEAFRFPEGLHVCLRTPVCATLGPACRYARGDGTDPSWFGAGVRVGMGLGLGVCLGLGLGAGLLMSSYQRASAAVKRIAPMSAATAEVMRLSRP